MADLHENIIIEPHYAEAIYQLRSLPKFGSLYLNGVKMKVGDRWTQANLADGTFQYVQDKGINTTVTRQDDSFTFVVPLPEGGILLPTTFRAACLPNAFIPDNGIFTFRIDITTIPRPKEIRNNEITIMEDESQCLTLSNLFYSSDTAPQQTPFIEQFQIIYKVTSLWPVVNGKGEYRLNGVPLKLGDTFTNADINNGALCVYGTNMGKGEQRLSFQACVQGPINAKCTSGVFVTNIEPWPYAEVENSSATINECQTVRAITPAELTYTVPFGSTPNQIVITYNAERTGTANIYPPKVEIIPSSFTQAAVNAGQVFIKHNCGDDPTLWSENVVFDVCTNHNKCNQKTFKVKVIPLPVVFPPQEPGDVTIPSGCTYRKKQNGSMELVKCGVWAEVSGRVVPDPETKDEGDIIHMPGAQPPVTLTVKKDKKGNKGWVQLPTNIPTAPSSDPTCESRATAPNSSKRVTSVVQFRVTGKISTGQSSKLKLTVDGIEVDLPRDGTIEYTRVHDTPTAGVKDIDMILRGEVQKEIKKGSVLVLRQENGPALTVSEPNVNSKRYKWEKVVNGDNKGEVEEVGLGNANARLKLDVFKEPKVRGQANKCFTAPDGTKWVSDSTGDWSPVDKDPATVDETPIITADPDAYVIQTNDPNTIQKPKPKTVYVKNKDVILTLQTDDTYAPTGSPFSEQYEQPPFTWIGPNEFWLPYGSDFDMPFFANRLYTRIDVLGSGAKSANQMVNQYGSKFYSSFANIGGGYSATTKNNVTIPVTAYPSQVPSKGNDPYEMGEYYYEFGDYVAAFAAAIRPVGVPQKSPSGSTAWIENTGLIFSYSGYGLGLRQARANVNVSGKGTANADGGAKFGTYYPYLHNQLWMMYGNTNFNPPQQYLGWQVGRLKMMANGMIGGLQDLSPFSGMPPKKDYNLSINVRAVDITTGERITRTFKIHWNKTGLSPNGNTSEVTDLDSITGGGVNPPKPGIAVCKFKGDGSVGNCTYIGG